ncbi:hypothetical protein [Sphingomonas sp. KC8]|uniref:hypothetical protein n=1 Tax=Sphingomonas sp. KC8 TaxID=1030157 RepID=UPI0012F78D8F|nr:hypothetical protein [Sphingomonas sp. KC8]
MTKNLFPGVPLIESPIFSLDDLCSDFSPEEKIIAGNLRWSRFPGQGVKRIPT